MRPRNDWRDLRFWNSGEYQVCLEKMNDLSKRGIRCTPARADVFKALTCTPIKETKVAIMGQDPYPNPEDATGVAFSIPVNRFPYPPTLLNIFKEYYDDLRYPAASSGNLETWTSRGVLLWNVYPVCIVGRPGSCHWDEWSYLTREIVEVLHARNTLLVSLGNVANSFIVDKPGVLHFSHPSPLGAKKGFHPFLGSRLFSTINGYLVDRGVDPIDWKLP